MGWVNWLWGGDDMEPRYEDYMVGKPVRYRNPVPMGSADVVCCSGCNREYKRCKCDPDLGRPAKWWEC